MDSMYSIAIDGPAGAGKSTIAKKVAKELDYIYVDTGAMYRAMALAYIRRGISKEDEQSIIAVCNDIEVSIEYENDEQQVLLNNENVNEYIRSEEVGKMTSAISVFKDVRLKLLALQRALASSKNVIMDGRDIGTYVLPNANVKIFLTASVETRAQRRYNELIKKGIECNIRDIMKDIEERDYRDSHREIAPLRQAEDAVLVDTSDMNIEQVVNRIREIVKCTEHAHSAEHANPTEHANCKEELK